MSRIVNGNIPVYVGVYNSLYSDIMNQVYLEDSQLPSETVLANNYGVSRNTLRQALAILREDGLIVKSQGKGTTVARRKKDTYHGKIVNPMTSMCNKKISDIEFHYNYGPPTDIGRAKLGLSKSDIVLASTNIYKHEDIIMGYSFIQIPTLAFKDLGVDSGSDSSLEVLLEKQIFDFSAKSLMDIKLIYANDMEAEILKIPGGAPLLLIEAILYDKNHQPFARCKFYFIAEYYQLHFQI